MNELEPTTPEPEQPTAEGEVIRRLKQQPDSVGVNARFRPDEQPRHWVTITYRFQGKLSRFGDFLVKIANDVFQAGGYVREFTFSSAGGLRPNNERPDDLTPSGPWLAMFVDVKIQTQKETHDRMAGFDEAVRDIARRYRGETKKK